MAANDFSRLELLCRRVTTLPVLPTTALQLIRTIDSGDASAAELEKIIVSDPSLSAEFLRLSANSQLGKEAGSLTSIRAGIMRMGQRTVRALATSLLVRDLIQKDSNGDLDQKRFGRHSLAVGLLAKFLYARQKMRGEFETAWTADEVFAAGLLADLGYVLMAKMLPDTFNRLCQFACKKGAVLDDTFVSAFGKPISLLAAAAADTWGLPDMFRKSLAFVHAPWEMPEESASLCCLHYAAALARDFGIGIESWTTQGEVPGPVLFEVGLEDEERANLRLALQVQMEAYADVLGSGKKAA